MCAAVGSGSRCSEPSASMVLLGSQVMRSHGFHRSVFLGTSSAMPLSSAALSLVGTLRALSVPAFVTSLKCQRNRHGDTRCRRVCASCKGAREHPCATFRNCDRATHDQAFAAKFCPGYLYSRSSLTIKMRTLVKGYDSKTYECFSMELTRLALGAHRVWVNIFRDCSKPPVQKN